MTSFCSGLVTRYHFVTVEPDPGRAKKTAEKDLKVVVGAIKSADPGAIYPVLAPSIRDLISPSGFASGISGQSGSSLISAELTGNPVIRNVSGEEMAFVPVTAEITQPNGSMKRESWYLELSYEEGSWWLY